MCAQNSFRFLDLPTELRLTVYERLTPTTLRHKIERRNEIPTDDDSTGSSFILSRKSFPVALLRTCKVINREASSIVAKKLRQLEREPIRIIAELATFNKVFNGRQIILDHVDDFLEPFVCFFGVAFAHILQARHLSDSGSHIEVALTNSDHRPSGMAVCLALIHAWLTIRQFQVSWTFFCQGLLPDAHLPSGAVFPAVLFWDAARATEITQEPLEHDKDSLMAVKELMEKDWIQLREDWDIW